MPTFSEIMKSTDTPVSTGIIVRRASGNKYLVNVAGREKTAISGISDDISAGDRVILNDVNGLHIIGKESIQAYSRKTIYING